MPQFDPSTFTSQLFWFVICFTTLILLMNQWLIPRLRQAIALRENYLENQRQQTAKLLAHGIALDHQVQHSITTVQQELKDALQQSIKEIEAHQRATLINYEQQLKQKMRTYEAALDQEVAKVKKNLSQPAHKIAEELKTVFLPSHFQDLAKNPHAN